MLKIPLESHIEFINIKACIFILFISSDTTEWDVKTGYLLGTCYVGR